MHDGCNMVFKHSDFLRILESDKTALDRYWANLCKSYADSNDSIKACHNSNCDLCFVIKSSEPPNSFMCECGYETCLLCESECHKPIMCYQKQDWNKKCEAITEEAILLEHIMCPKCKTLYNKDSAQGLYIYCG